MKKEWAYETDDAKRAAKREEPESRLAREKVKRLSDRDVRARGVPDIVCLSTRLDQREGGQDGEDQARRSGDEESDAPAPRSSDDASERHAEQGADGDAHRVDRHRARARSLGEIVADQRVRGRRTTCFADANAHAADREDSEIPRHAGEQREAAPDGKRDGHDGRPVALVSEARNRNAEYGIEDREPEPAHGADLEVVELQLVLDRLDELRDDLTIKKVDGVDRDEQGEGIPPVGHRHGRCWRSRINRGRFAHRRVRHGVLPARLWPGADRTMTRGWRKPTRNPYRSFELSCCGAAFALSRLRPSCRPRCSARLSPWRRARRASRQQPA